MVWATTCSHGVLAAAELFAQPEHVGAASARSMSLDGTWSLTFGSTPDAPHKLPQTTPPAGWPTIPATVPGNVELDMAAAGYLEPLEKGNRVYQALNIEFYQWWYKRTFRAPPRAGKENVDLIFDGLDCLATVWLNGKLVGHSANMLIAQRFDVTKLLLPGEDNEIIVRIDPAVPVGLAVPQSAWERPGSSCKEALHIRKAPHMYGWDIMPRVVSAGIWRGVRLEWQPQIRLSSIRWTTNVVDSKQNRAVVAAAWEIVADNSNKEDYKLEFELRRGGRTTLRTEVTHASVRGQREFTLDPVALWWPRGYGEPALYETTVTLWNREGVLLDQCSDRIGIRTIELDRTDIVLPDKPGVFQFLINDIPIFVKGNKLGSPRCAAQPRRRVTRQCFSHAG